MNIKDFIAGNFIQRYEYRSFEPKPINHIWTWDEPEINMRLEKANKLLGELNAFTYIVPDIDLFIAMHILKEATKSSKIEGTKTDIDEAVLPVEEISPEKRDDWLEVHNYIKAINFAVNELENLPISTRLIKETHRILIDGSRGENKTPGEFRKSQNWIGGNSLSDAVFVPPHFDSLPHLLTDLDFFINNTELKVPHLIKIALIHYQFETIHPFLDGNGRIGRLLITLYLVSNKIIGKPSLYLSDYFEKHRALYYDSLTMVREKNDIAGWINFFLQAVEHTAENSIITFRKIFDLKNKYDIFISNAGYRAGDIRILINYLYKSPVIDTITLAGLLKKDKRTVRRIIDILEEAGILKEVTGYRRNRNYVLNDYLLLFLK